MTRRDEDEKERRFLSRWSRMKRDAMRPEEPAGQKPALPAQAEPAAEETPAEEAITEEEIAALPPVDSVTDRAGLEPFFRKGVPATLRNAARRRMWMMNPKISDYLDVARDYAYDWNTPGGVPGSGGPLAPGMAAELVKNMISRGEWRAAGERPSAEEARPPQDRPDAAGEQPQGDLVFGPAPAACVEAGESAGEATDMRCDEAGDCAQTPSTFGQGICAEAENAGTGKQPPEPSRRHGRATPV